jgi:NAD(P)-dependent dehydrogenase (short-subunit alcohol dehydrogenase family)
MPPGARALPPQPQAIEIDVHYRRRVQRQQLADDQSADDRDPERPAKPAKAYVHSLGEALHYEFKPLGVYVTVLAAGFTNTAVLEKFGLDPKTMPMKPMSVEQCVSKGLSGLLKNRSRIVPGRLNRIMNALVPASLARKIEADMLGKGLASKSAPANALAEA